MHASSQSRALLYAILISAPLLALSVALTVRMADIRFDELRFLFRNAEEKTEGYRTLGLVSRFMLMRDRAEREDSGADYLREGKIFLSLGKTLSEESTRPKKILDWIAVEMLDAANGILGLKTTERYANSRTYRLAEQAYLFELSREYERAAEKFLAAAESADRSSREYFQSLLHRGFCLALAGKPDSAIADFDAILRSETPREIRLTAEILRGMVAGFSGAYGAIAAMPDSEFKGEKLFRRAFYRSAIDVLSRGGADRLSNRGRFYLGRSYEEIGELSKAIPEYRRLVSTPSPYARTANRRLMLLGVVHGGGTALAEEAKKNAAALSDTGFADELTFFAETAKRIRELQTAISRDAGITTSKDAPPLKTAEDGPMTGIKPPAKPAPDKVVIRVTTSDGNILVGQLVAERPDSITLATVAGRVKIPKERIAARQRIGQ